MWVPPSYHPPPPLFFFWLPNFATVKYATIGGPFAILNVSAQKVKMHFVSFRKGSSRSSKMEGNRHTALLNHHPFSLAIPGKPVSEYTEGISKHWMIPHNKEQPWSSKSLC